MHCNTNSSPPNDGLYTSPISRKPRDVRGGLPHRRSQGMLLQSQAELLSHQYLCPLSVTSAFELCQRASQRKVCREGGLGQALKCQEGDVSDKRHSTLGCTRAHSPFSLAQKKVAGLNAHPAEASRELGTGRRRYHYGPRADHGNGWVSAF